MVDKSNPHYSNRIFNLFNQFIINLSRIYLREEREMKLFHIMTGEESERFIDGYYNKFWRKTYIYDIWKNLTEGEVFEVTSKINLVKLGDGRFSIEKLT